MREKQKMNKKTNFKNLPDHSLKMEKRNFCGKAKNLNFSGKVTLWVAVVGWLVGCLWW